MGRKEITGQVERKQKPGWLKTKIPAGSDYFKLKKELESKGLSTICQSARCPNVCECWNNYNATFLVMGNTCSRNCLFCSVPNGTPTALDPDEASKILEMVEIMGSKYIVITSVTRDDLKDGGSNHFAGIVESVKEARPDLKIEVLIPDFKGDTRQLDRILKANPDVLNHNLETVKHLYSKVNRNQDNYHVSLGVLEYCKSKGSVTKSGIMVGLGESLEDLKELFGDLVEIGTDLLTIGQYLQPTGTNLPVEKYYTPDEFDELRRTALSIGFSDVSAGPFVRSSFQAQRMFNQCSDQINKRDKKRS